MKVRILATMLWFIAGWSATGFLVVVTGLPSAVAVIGGLATAMIVWFHPASVRLSAGSKATRRIRPIEEVAAELDERARLGTPETVEKLAR